jgi:hypothetical protein
LTEIPWCGILFVEKEQWAIKKEIGLNDEIIHKKEYLSRYRNGLFYAWYGMFK